MRIQADRAGMEVLRKLIDISLRSGGIENLNAVTEILKNVKQIREEKTVSVKSGDGKQ